MEFLGNLLQQHKDFHSILKARKTNVYVYGIAAW